MLVELTLRLKARRLYGMAAKLAEMGAPVNPKRRRSGSSAWLMRKQRIAREEACVISCMWQSSWSIVIWIVFSG